MFAKNISLQTNFRFSILLMLLFAISVPAYSQVLGLPNLFGGGVPGGAVPSSAPGTSQNVIGVGAATPGGLAPGLSGNTQATSAPAIGSSAGDNPATNRRVQRLQQAGYTPEQIFQILQKEADSIAAAQPNITPAVEAPSPATPTNVPVLSPMGELSEAQRFHSPVVIGYNKDTTYAIIEEYNDLGEKRQRKQPVTLADLEAQRESDRRRHEVERQKALRMVFGQAIFADESVLETFLSDTAIASPSDAYIVGPGDIFTITAWGAAELYESLLVAEDGSVGRQFLGKVYLGGRTYAEARQILRQRYLGMIDSRAQIEVTLAPQRRSIAVNIVGEAVRPNKYTIPATMSAFTAMFAARGITPLGTVRNIQIKRDGKLIQRMDLYDYLLEGKTNPIYLKSEDFIFVPVQGRVIQIQGAVRRPTSYELTDTETLADLIRFAGGLQYTAKTVDVQLSRIVDGKQQIINFNLEKALAEGFKLQNGDAISIRNVNSELRNVVSISGAVYYPSSYELRKGDHLLDVINRAGGAREVVYLERAYVRRRISPLEHRYLAVKLSNLIDSLGKPLPGAAQDTSNIALQEFDEVIIFSKEDFFTKRSIRIEGSVNSPTTIPIMPTLSLKTVLYLAGGLREDADLNTIILSVRLKPEDSNAPSLQDSIQSGIDSSANLLVRRIGISENWKTDPTLDTIMVSEYSNIKVYSKLDFAFSEKISIAGAVRSPRQMSVYRGMTLKDALLLAGGLSQNLDGQTVELYARIDPRLVGLSGMGTGNDGVKRISIGRDWLQDPRLDTFQVTSYTSIVVRNPTEYVRPGYVEIKGLVASPARYPTMPGMTMKDLLYACGGLDLSANFNKIEVTRILDSVSPTGEIRIIPVKEKVISVSQNWQTDPRLDTFLIYPFDQVFVRQDPNFKLQESVQVTGEVWVPGEYNKLKRDERLASLVARAGGLTELSYTRGAFVTRPGAGKVSIQLKKAVRRPKSRHNIILLAGDVLNVPAKQSTVSISGNVWSGASTIAYDKSVRRLKYYTNLAGGFKKKTSRKNITVSYMDGRMKKAKSYLFFIDYPRMEEGAVVTVPTRREVNFSMGLSSINVNLSNTIREISALSTSALTLVVLLRAIAR